MNEQRKMRVKEMLKREKMTKENKKERMKKWGGNKRIWIEGMERERMKRERNGKWKGMGSEKNGMRRERERNGKRKDKKEKGNRKR